MNKKVVYISGCCGLIGSHLTRMCLNIGWQVRGIDKLTYAANFDVLDEFKKYENFTFDQVDINDIKFLYDHDVFINTAAETHVGNSIVCSKDFIKSNIDGVHNILELYRNYRQEDKNKPIFLHLSTDEIYGDIFEGEHVETDLVKPSNPYSATKASSDMLIMAWNRTYSIPYIIVRPTNQFGTGQYVEKLIPKTIKYLGLGRKIPLHNNGTPIRNWLHVEDTCDAILKIIDAGVKNEIFNICGGFEQSNIVTVSKIINCYIGRDMNFELTKQEMNDYLDFRYSRPGQDVRYALNDSKLRNLGWCPKKKFDEELPKIVEYHKSKFIW